MIALCRGCYAASEAAAVAGHGKPRWPAEYRTVGPMVTKHHIPCGFELRVDRGLFLGLGWLLGRDAFVRLGLRFQQPLKNLVLFLLIGVCHGKAASHIRVPGRSHRAHCYRLEPP